MLTTLLYLPSAAPSYSTTGTQLEDLENELLLIMQQNAAYSFGSAPNFTLITNPAFNKSSIDFYINRGYERAMADTARFQIYTTSAVFPSTASTWNYVIPPSGSPTIAMVFRVLYQPVNFPYKIIYDPGKRLIATRDFNFYSGEGLLSPYTFASYPTTMAISDDRTQLWLYPGSLNAGDTITLQYAPLPTPGTSVPFLVNNTDQPVLPSDTRQAIVEWASYTLWLRMREMQQAGIAKQNYSQEIERIKYIYDQRSLGDQTGFMDQLDALGMPSALGFP